MNKNEKRYYNKLTKEGWKVAHAGWPDFIVIKNGKVRLIELKSGNDRLSTRQKEMHKLIKEGMSIEVEVINMRVFNDEKLAAKLRPMLRPCKNRVLTESYLPELLREVYL